MYIKLTNKIIDEYTNKFDQITVFTLEKTLLLHWL